MFNNKKGDSHRRIFFFFFALMFISGLFFFMLTALPAILYDYGIQFAVDANQNLVNLGVSSNSSQTSINNLATGYTNLYDLADYAFLFIIVSAFIQSILASVNAVKRGIFSFFGYITIGNVFLIFIMSFAINIRDWFLDNIVYNILTISIETPFFSFFFNNSYYIGMFWYITLLVINMIDFKRVFGAKRFGDTGGGIKFEK